MKSVLISLESVFSFLFTTALACSILGAVFFEPKAKYVWALALDKAGGLLVATGDKGEIYRVDRKGDGKLFVDGESFKVEVPASKNDVYMKYVDKSVIMGVRPEDIHDPHYLPPAIIPQPVDGFQLVLPACCTHR
jgi:hypothetical protein